MKGRRLGEFEELVLLAVRQLEEGATVLPIREVLAETARRKASMGAIYAALDRLERKGLSVSRLGGSPSGSGGRARRYYALTEAGEKALADSRAVREAMWMRPGEARP